MRYKQPHNGMLHLNGNLLCAVDVETTGLEPGFHDLVQVAILPLNGQIRPSKTAKPFYMNLAPKRPENIDRKAVKINRIDFAKLIQNSIDPDKAADLFHEWFERLELPITVRTNKKIMPLWSNGSFDKGFLIDWLGQEHYRYYFHFFERDTQSLALSINDRFDQHTERVPFPKVGLSYLASQMDITNQKPHDALQDCITTAETYRRMLRMRLP